jgi:hypothetical protein
MSNNKSRNQKARKRGRKGGNDTQFKEEDQDYAIAIASCGHHWRIKCLDDGVERLGKPRKSRSLKRFNVGDYLLVAKRIGMTQNNLYDIIVKYSEEQVRHLRSCGELPDSKDNDNDEKEKKNNDKNDCGFDFEEI